MRLERLNNKKINLIAFAILILLISRCTNPSINHTQHGLHSKHIVQEYEIIMIPSHYDHNGDQVVRRPYILCSIIGSFGESCVIIHV